MLFSSSNEDIIDIIRSTDPSIIGSSIEAYLSSTDLLDKVEEVEGEDLQQQSTNEPTTSSTSQRCVLMRIRLV